LREIVGRYPGHDLQADEAPHSSSIRDLRTLDLPVLVINGERDSGERHAAGGELARALPNAHRIVIPDAGHLTSLDNPSAYNEALEEFFGRQLTAALGKPESSSQWSTQHAE
jgi:pimeloyl-ACP methyl ester carboxylesterase